MIVAQKRALNLSNYMVAKLSQKIHEIDASNQAPGRLAAQIVTLLRGKHKAAFDPRLNDGDTVVVANARALKFTGRKLVQKDYYHHSMYPGGLKRTPMKRVFDLDPAAVIRHAVYGMLPKNSHRDRMMKRLTIKP